MSQRSAAVDTLSAVCVRSGEVEAEMTRVRILIVSDVRLYREALALRLGQNDRLAILGAVGHDDAVCDVDRFEPDLVLLDIGEWRGLDLATTLLVQRPELQIVAIAVPEIAGHAMASMWRGIAGFVPRNGSIEDVISELDRLTACGRCDPITIAAPALVPPKAAKAEAEPHSRVGVLTPREYEILKMIELGLSNKEIARNLRIEVGTVKNHVHNILEKLNVGRRHQAAHQMRTRLIRG
jgi:DNA-binding NarL/FixJ family response regulator